MIGCSISLLGKMELKTLCKSANPDGSKCLQYAINDNWCSRHAKLFVKMYKKYKELEGESEYLDIYHDCDVNSIPETQWELERKSARKAYSLRKTIFEKAYHIEHQNDGHKRRIQILHDYIGWLNTRKQEGEMKILDEADTDDEKEHDELTIFVNETNTPMSKLPHKSIIIQEDSFDFKWSIIDLHRYIHEQKCNYLSKIMGTMNEKQLRTFRKTLFLIDAYSKVINELSSGAKHYIVHGSNFRQKSGKEWTDYLLTAVCMVMGNITHSENIFEGCYLLEPNISNFLCRFLNDPEAMEISYDETDHDLKDISVEGTLINNKMKIEIAYDGIVNILPYCEYYSPKLVYMKINYQKLYDNVKNKLDTTLPKRNKSTLRKVIKNKYACNCKILEQDDGVDTMIKLIYHYYLTNRDSVFMFDDRCSLETIEQIILSLKINVLCEVNDPKLNGLTNRDTNIINYTLVCNKKS